MWLDLAGGHWTDDVADVNAAAVFLYLTVADPGNGAVEAFEDRAYRCVTGQVLR